MQETQETLIRSLGGEDALEEGTTTQSSVPAWRIPWTEESDGLQSIGSQRVRHAWSDIAQQRKLATVWKISPSDWTDTKAVLPM